jgi:hypothetical protein
MITPLRQLGNQRYYWVRKLDALTVYSEVCSSVNHISTCVNSCSNDSINSPPPSYALHCNLHHTHITSIAQDCQNSSVAVRVHINLPSVEICKRHINCITTVTYVASTLYHIKVVLYHSIEQTVYKFEAVAT